jgi:hypothetical protein
MLYRLLAIRTFCAQEYSHTGTTQFSKAQGSFSSDFELLLEVNSVHCSLACASCHLVGLLSMESVDEPTLGSALNLFFDTHS